MKGETPVRNQAQLVDERLAEGPLHQIRFRFGISSNTRSVDITMPSFRRDSLDISGL
ncbi:MAG: hypothetical protein M1587_04140 [Thaumarchaeota archaeon]|nr:hypothetical protein [Nitrososphaerota archaeon]